MAKKQGRVFPEQVIEKIRQGELAPVYFLQGEETHFIDTISSYIEKNVLDESEKDFNQVVLYGKETDVNQLVDHARQFPLMASRRVVIVREAQEMRNIADLQSYVEKFSPHTVLVINHKYKTINPRTSFGKSLEQHAYVYNASRIYENEVPGWIQQQGKKYQLHISGEAAILITEFLGTDLSRIHRELEKLSMILGNEQNLSLEDVKIHIGQSKDYNVFELNNALGERHILKANRIIRYFASNPKSTHIVVVVASLYGFFSKVLVTQENMEKNDMTLAGLIGTSPFFVKDYRKAARNYPRSKLHAIMAILAEYDLRSKGVGNKNADHDELLKELIFKILH